MATSGTMTGNHISIGGYGSQYYFINWQLAAQNTGANQSTINWQAYFHFNVADAQLTNGSANLNGARWSNAGTVKNFAGTYTTRNHHIVSSHFNLGHNSDGNQTLNVSGGISVPGGRSQGSASWALTKINRYAAINSWSLNNVTEKSIGVTLSTNATVNAVQYSLNGAGWVTAYSGNFTSRSFSIGGLNPATNYTIKIRVRRADSGLWTDSGNRSATTTAVTITSLTVPSATDTTLTLRAVVNRTANRLEYRRNSTGSWIAGLTSNFTTGTFQITGLTPNQNYTYQVRARHADSNTWTPAVTVTGRTAVPVPLKPTNLSPNSSSGLATQTPRLAWVYNATGTDSQTAFQVIIRNSATGTTVHDSGKVNSDTNGYTVPAGVLAWNVNYTWEVRTWSGTGLQGPYSDTALFRTTEAPTVVVTLPEAGAELANASPEIGWTYSHTGSSPQQSFRVVIEQINQEGDTQGTVVFDTTVNNADDTNYILPAESLQNNTRYIVRVYATTQDGATGVSEPVEFTVNFIAPTDPTISLDLSEDVLFVAMSADSGVPEDDGYEVDLFNFYRRSGTEEWALVGRAESQLRNIQSFDSTDWNVTEGNADLYLNDDAKEGDMSLGINTSGAGTVQIERTPELTSLDLYDRIRVWVKSLAPSSLTRTTVKFGIDESNFYYITINASDMEYGVWESIEVNVNDLSIQGNPDPSSINWSAVEVVSTAAIENGGLSIDGLRAVPIQGTVQALDYELANGKQYEYAVRAFSSRASMESNLVIYAEPVKVTYTDMQNTYLIPIYAESKAVVGLMDAKSLPAWNVNTEKVYYKPVNARHPVVYSRGEQLYRTGNIQLRFLDEKHGGLGLDGAKGVRDIINDRPIMLRTWWGDILYISIDDQVNIARDRAVSWNVSFNFTEIGNDGEL